MKNKRGLSSVVTTILIIVLMMSVVAGLALVINNFVKKGSSQLSVSRFTVSVSIESAFINFEDRVSSVRVKRNTGMGDLVGIKFIFEDSRNSEVFDRRVVGFDELEERTFDINLSESYSVLDIFNLERVSIAPIIKLESGEEVIGNVQDFISGLNEGISGGNLSGNYTGGDPSCLDDIDCGENYFLEGTRFCNGDLTEVHQYQRIFSCILGVCYDDVIEVTIEECGYQCYDGRCIQELVVCSPENVTIVCGEDGWIGPLGCSQDGTAVVQTYKTYSCVNSTCVSELNSIVKEECEETENGTEICFQGECFIPLECVEHIDCDFGEVCIDGSCELETALNSGTVYSIWPFSVGEYFDSESLPDPNNISYVGYKIVFPGSSQQGCLEIDEHLMPNVTGAYPYVRLNVSVSDISNGDNYEIWETNYICSLY